MDRNPTMAAFRCIQVLSWLVFAGLACQITGIRASLAGTQTVQESAGDAAAKQAILQSPAWSAAVEGFNDWLSVQITYPAEEVPQLKAEFEARVEAMSAVELQSFLTDLQQKLAILNGPDALEARAWAEQKLQVYADAKAAEFRKSMPDVARMTALQVAQALEDLKQRRASDAMNRQRFEQFRDRQVAAARQRQQTQAVAAARAASSHPGFRGGSYAPRTSNRPQIQRYPGPFIGYGYRGGWRW